MKILLVTEFFPKEGEAMTGGVEARTYHLAQGLRAAGHEIGIISRKRTQVAATPLSVLARFWFQIAALIQGFTYKPGVVEGSNYVSYLPAFAIAKFKKAKAIAWFPDVYDKTWFQTMSWPVALTGYVAEAISLKLPWDKVIAMSNSTKNKLIRAGVKPERIKVVYGGVDLDKIAKIKGMRNEIPTICTAARLVNYKHIDDLVKAVGMVQKKHPELKLEIMGDGPERMNLEILSMKFTKQNSVRFRGNLPQDEVWRRMKQASIFSLPSNVEGFGLVTVEAMACGLPYVSADIPATREVTEGGKGGILFPSRNVKQLAAGIEALLDRTTHKQKVAEAIALAQKYDWQKITQKTLQVYFL